VLVLGTAGLAGAQDMTGDDVLDKVEAAIDADSAKISFDMELHSSSGDVRNRELKARTQDGEVDKSFIRFLAPASVEGTGFLSQDKGDSEDMYLYMPALGSIRKISSSQKNGSFVGTDFSYNDLSILGGGNYQDDYEATVQSEDDSQYVLKIVPTDDDIDYKYGKMWVQKSNWFPVKLEFYDSDGELHKVLTTKDVKQIDGYWTAGQMTMKNVQKGSKTVLQLAEIAYDKEIDDRLFTTRNLKRY